LVARVGWLSRLVARVGWLSGLVARIGWLGGSWVGWSRWIAG